MDTCHTLLLTLVFIGFGLLAQAAPVVFPEISAADRAARLTPPEGRVRMVLDTDTYNEIDDQFAVVYAVLSKEKLDLEAIYAAPFDNARSEGAGDGMEKSYQEILRILDFLKVPSEEFVFRGSTDFLQDWDHPHRSPAALDLVERSKSATPEKPLYVVPVGAITNVASAILIDPSIINRIVVVWLGGQPQYWPDTQEFNLKQDLPAARVVFDSGVPLVRIPCATVASHLLTTVPEIEHYLQGKGAIGDYLVKIFKDYHEDHYAWGKVIWDISAIAWLLNPGWIPSSLKPSPILLDDVTWKLDPTRHQVREADFVWRNPVFKDLFKKIENAQH